MHGHSYRLEVAIRGPLQTHGPTAGMVEDFETFEGIVNELVLVQLDHRTLNDLVENPTAENMVLWVWDRLSPVLQGLEEVGLWETASSGAVMHRGDLHS